MPNIVEEERAPGIYLDTSMILDPAMLKKSGPITVIDQHGRSLIPVACTLALDPAFSQREGSSQNAITVVACDSLYRFWVLEASRMRKSESEIIEHIVDYAIRYAVWKMSFEAVVAQVLYRPLLTRRFEELGLNIIIEDYKKSSTENKMKRIRALEPLHRGQKLLIRRGLIDLYDEMKAYPQTTEKSADLLDSLAQHLEIARPPRRIEREQEDEEDEETPPLSANGGRRKMSVGRGARL